MEVGGWRVDVEGGVWSVEGGGWRVCRLSDEREGPRVAGGARGHPAVDRVRALLIRGGLVFKAHRLLYHPTLGSKAV